MKKSNVVLGIFFFLLLGVVGLFISTNLMSIEALANVEENYVIGDSEKIFSINEEIILEYEVESYADNVSYNIETIGFSIINSGYNNEKLIVELDLVSNSNEYYVEVAFDFENSQVRSSYYGIIANEKLYLSNRSKDEAVELFAQDYYISNRGNANVLDENSAVSMYSLVENEMAQIFGKLSWFDYQKSQILRGVKLVLCDITGSSFSILAEGFSDGNGEYSFTFENTDIAREFMLFVYAGDGNVEVITPGEATYFTTITCSQTGLSTELDFNINMDEYVGQAFQISQAVFTARNFVRSMCPEENDSSSSDLEEEKPSAVSVLYPYVDPNGSTNSHYNHSEKKIYLNEANSNVYGDWDVIMHEYGHHVQYEFGITQNPGGSHKSDENDADARQNKSEGVRLAWGEAWPTVFGELAQQYYSSNLIGINKVADISYGWGYNYDLITEDLGEACERSIMAVLWDLFDNQMLMPYSQPKVDDDLISMTYQQWWDVTTGSGATTFSEFITYFYNQYPEHIEKIAPNLVKYKMAPTPPVAEKNENSEYPRFSWDGQGGSVHYPNNSFVLMLYNDVNNESIIIETTDNYVDLTAMQWETISNWGVEEFFGVVVGGEESDPLTGPYYSTRTVFSVPVFVIENVTTTGGVIIADYCSPLPTDLYLPTQINGKNVVEIGDSAFGYLSGVRSLGFENDSVVTTIGLGAFAFAEDLVLVSLPNSLVTLESLAFAFGPDEGMIVGYNGTTWTTIGIGAFYKTKLPALAELPASIVTIEDSAFYESDFYSHFRFAPNNCLRTIGSQAFAKTDITELYLSSQITTIGSKAFDGVENLTLYVEPSSKPSGWASDWNSSNRPVIWGCTLSADKSYVVSVNKTSSSISNASATGGITAPFREDYTFGGWYTTSDFGGTQYTDITQAPNGTLYAKWTEKSCVAEGTMVTLADGSEVAVESLTGNEQLLVWNLLTGSYDVAPILFVDCDELSSYRVIELTFSDGTEVKVIDEHGFWCYELNEYVYLDENASSYVGYHFKKKSGDSYTSVTLVGVEIYYETTRAYSPVTYGHLCYFVNGMLSMPGGIGGLFNIFEVDATTMSYDQEAMEEDIAEYGIYTYEEFTQEVVAIPEEIFNAFNGAYLKVAIGKGLITEEEIVGLAVRYAEFF